MVYWISPWLFLDPSTLMAGKGRSSRRKVRWCFLAKLVFIISPSAPLSSRTVALIFFSDSFPTRAPLSVIDGANRFLVTEVGTASESNVSR